MTDSKSEQRAARRVMWLMKALKGHSLKGVAQSELARAIGEKNDSTVMRTLEAMQAEGFAVKNDEGRWSLGVAALGVCEAHHEEMSRGINRIREFDSRVKAEAAA